MTMLEKYQHKMYRVRMMGREHYIRAVSYSKSENLIRFSASGPTHPQVQEYIMDGILLLSPEMFETVEIVKVFEVKSGEIIVHFTGDEEFQPLIY